jgi:hypothetical protein
MACRVDRDMAGGYPWSTVTNDLERHGGRTPAGVFARIAQRLLAMAACIWHNWRTGTDDLRSLTAYDH